MILKTKNAKGVYDQWLLKAVYDQVVIKAASLSYRTKSDTNRNEFLPSGLLPPNCLSNLLELLPLP